MIHDRVHPGPASLGGAAAHLREVQHGVQSELLRTLGRPKWRLWFRDVDVVRVESERVTFAVPTEVHRTWIEYTFADDLRQACARVLGEGVAVAVEVGAHQHERRLVRERLPQRPDEWERLLALRRPAAAFTTFLPRPADRFPVRLLESLVHGAGPGAGATVFLYGEPGCGKTHLLQALARAVEAQAPGESLLLSAKRFTSLVVTALRTGEVAALRAFETDLARRRLVLLDGLDGLEGRPATQAQLVRLLERSAAGGARWVLAGRRPPRELPGLLPTLVSRLMGGPVVRLGLPDRGLQAEILVARARAQGVEVPAGVVDALLERTGSLRAAVQWLDRWALASERLGAPLEARWLEEVAPGLSTATRDEVVRRAKAAVAEHFGLDPALLDRPTKQRSAALPRRVALYLVYRATALPLGALGRAFGWRSHSSVSRALSEMRRLREDDASTEQLVDGLLARL